MLEEFEKELINTIREVAEPKNSVIRAYLGEFNNKEEMELLIKGGESFIFVEFVDYYLVLNLLVSIICKILCYLLCLNLIDLLIMVEVVMI